MTELYRDIARNQRVVLFTLSEEERKELQESSQKARARYDERPKNIFDSLSTTFTGIMDYLCDYYEPLVIYSHKDYLDAMIPASHSWIRPERTTTEQFTKAYQAQRPRTRSPLGRSYVEYQYYTISPDSVTANSLQPFCINQQKQGSHHPDEFRLKCSECNYYDRSYTMIYCIERSDTVTGGNLIFYPHYAEENADYLTACIAPQTDLDVPLREGSAILLSGDTYYMIQPMRGQGVCRLMIVDLYLND